MGDGVVATCVVHQQAPASGTCTRCGGFLCEPCMVSGLCAPCVEREPLEKRVRPRPVPAPVQRGPLTALRLEGEVCPQQHVTVAEARANADRLCPLLDEWDIVRLADGGSMDGRGYKCKVHEHDQRSLGFSLCRK
jgi:hypothetical protein